MSPVHSDDTVSIVAVDPQHPDALALLHLAALEARQLYPDLIAADAPMPTNPPAEPRSVYLVAYRGGRPAACGALRPLPGEADAAEMRRIYVRADERRGGLARRVVEALEAQAVALGYRRMLLETGNRQAPAIAFYQACGYQLIPPFGAYQGDPTSVCFAKTMEVATAVSPLEAST